MRVDRPLVALLWASALCVSGQGLAQTPAAGGRPIALSLTGDILPLPRARLSLPAIPAGAAITGTIEIETAIDSGGRVAGVWVARTIANAQGLEQAALDAVKGSQFQEVRSSSGNAVAVLCIVRFDIGTSDAGRPIVQGSVVAFHPRAPAAAAGPILPLAAPPGGGGDRPKPPVVVRSINPSYTEAAMRATHG